MKYGKYPNAFYRVTLKAIIEDADGRILMVKEKSDFWDLPGGGWDHSENLEAAFARELTEEIGYEGAFVLTYARTVPIFAPRLDGCVLFLVYGAHLSHAYSPHAGRDATEVAFRERKQILADTSRTGRIIASLIGEGDMPFSDEA